MDPFTILGIVLIALGSFLTYYGAQRQSRDDSAKVEGKVETVLQQIQSLRTGALSPEAAKQLDSIDQEFRTWAADFVKNKERTKLEIEETRLGDVKSQMEKSDLWRPVLEVFLQSLRGSIAAYVAETNTDFSVDLPPLPPNLFDKNTQYAGKVIFSPKVLWKIRVTPDATGLLKYPILWIEDSIDNRDVQLAHVLSINSEGAFVSVGLDSDHLPRLKGLEGSFAPENYKDGLRRSAQRLVEAQVLALK